jgi:DNA-binding NtrC family response regulator
MKKGKEEGDTVIDAQQHYEESLEEDGSEAPVESASTFDIVSASRSDAPVLLTGGAKEAEALAREIHSLSGWRHGRFLVLDCGSLSEVELVGVLQRLLFPESQPSEQPEPRLRQDGTLLLRNIEKLPLRAQRIVSDWLETGSGSNVRRAGRRLMATASTTLLPAVLEGRFDAGVYYRLNVLHLIVPVEAGRR